MDPYQILKALQDSGQFDKLRAEIFANLSLQSQFEIIQQRLITELSSSPLLLDVPLKMRQARLPQIFNSFRLAVRKTSVANDIHSVLWTVIHEMVPQIYSAIECATTQPIQSQADHNLDPRLQNYINQTENANARCEPNKEQAESVMPNPTKTENVDTVSPVEAATPCMQTNIKSPPGELGDGDNDNEFASEPKKLVKSSKAKKRGRLVRLDSNEVDEDGSRFTSDDECVPAQKKGAVSTLSSPQEPISKRVEIWWPLDKCWYKGIVTSFRARDKKHHIRYDDNEIEWLDLLKERWRYE